MMPDTAYLTQTSTYGMTLEIDGTTQAAAATVALSTPSLPTRISISATIVGNIGVTTGTMAVTVGNMGTKPVSFQSRSQRLASSPTDMPLRLLSTSLLPSKASYHRKPIGSNSTPPSRANV